MTDARNVLRLAPAVRAREWEDGNVVRRPESHFLDLVVDGVSLRRLVPDAHLVTELNRPWLAGVPDAVDVLLGRRPHPALEGGRVPLLVCAVCGDLDDGAVSVRLDVADDAVTWSDWQWEDYQGSTRIDGPAPRMRFDRAAYEAELLAAPARVAALPYDELAHRGRRFLWPWQWGWRLPKG